ncbi:GNAT family N-acetyltransferase [Dyadobacter sediminis]|uniref:GNAT family N-acetyltransferase n=1 Tax=Dyadobacter sediminis TaxID=1493691 RepID=A0A5R9KIC0_9BACT|nr:GNAT family N-acetyltransferase [Dyadobacter sediminis]TLU95924.1 GNAT family N-acetyltransferase [Dyadobacter sediminis]GGB77777.1 alanine acetyltransferase [Dyadobacter sediminis]
MLILNFNPFPVLETSRMRLHALSATAHAEGMYLLRSNTEAMKYIGKPLLGSVAEAREIIDLYNRNLRECIGITWGISLKSSSDLIGSIGFHKLDIFNHRAEIGYMLHPHHWNKGLMSEAIVKVLDYGFQVMYLHSIEARINPDNELSRKILLKQNFIKEGYFRESYYENRKYLDTEVYSLLRK